MIWDLQITERDGVRVHRSRLEPGEASPWHVDSCHRVTVVLQGEQLRIEYQDGGEPELVPVGAGQVDWDEPSTSRRIHHPQGWWPTEMNRSGCSNLRIDSQMSK
jgi:hypothetical protein